MLWNQIPSDGISIPFHIIFFCLVSSLNIYNRTDGATDNGRALVSLDTSSLAHSSMFADVGSKAIFSWLGQRKLIESNQSIEKYRNNHNVSTTMKKMFINQRVKSVRNLINRRTLANHLKEAKITKTKCGTWGNKLSDKQKWWCWAF